MDKLVISSYCVIRKGIVVTPGERIGFPDVANDGKFLKEVFKHIGGSYSKFYKMDRLCKLAYLASEFLLATDQHKKYDPEEVALVFANSNSSLDSDLRHQKSIANRESYFPEPAVFVYTLPNIMLGELSIRHNLKGENMFFVSEKFIVDWIWDYTKILLDCSRHKACIFGWVDYTDVGFLAALYFVEPAMAISELEYTPDNLRKILEY
ncbi:MAG: 3-oxoacyl-ACP synthase [Bacteroidetes bacterium]|nr:3-oxoacyl-ACP synthase [Bacteroidota bacterium]